MIILITGTPGTGKSSVVEILTKKINAKLISLNAIEGVYFGVDEERGSNIVDMKRLTKKIEDMLEGDVVIDGHLTHLLPFGDFVIVLRTDPNVLRGRLEEKGFGKEKIHENLEAEALDVCLVEAIEKHKNVYEIDTTKKSSEETVADIITILEGRTEEFKPGKIDWSEEFFS